jgi:carboxymethylenebutenolidase
MRSLALAVVASPLLLACQGPPQANSTAAETPEKAETKVETKTEPERPDRKAEPGGETRDAPRPMTNTGILSEQEFAALHELTDAKAPPAKGIEIELAGSKAYLSLPEGAKAPLPGVVVIQEWWGLNDHIRHWTDRLAADGYAALAVDLYGGKVATTPEKAMEMMKAVDDAKAREILTAAHRFLAEDPRVKAGKRGVIGWCFGGGWSLQHALMQRDLDAAVIYYGRLETDPTALAAIAAPVLGVFGNEDKGIPPEAVDEFAAAMKAAGRSLELRRYDAPHAFANPSSAHYDAKAAEDAWGHVRAFFAAHLRG